MDAVRVYIAERQVSCLLFVYLDTDNCWIPFIALRRASQERPDAIKHLLSQPWICKQKCSRKPGERWTTDLTTLKQTRYASMRRTGITRR